MKINSINTTVIRNNINSKQNLRNHNITTITFKASAYEAEVEKEVESKRANYNWFEWNLFGQEEKERQYAKEKIDKRNRENEINLATAQVQNRENAKRLEDLRNYTNNLEQLQRKNDAIMADYKKSHEETVLIQKQALEAQKQAAESLKSQLEDYQRLIKEQKELQAKKDKETQEILKKMEEAREKRDKKMEERYEKEFQRMKEMYEAQIKAKAQEAEKVRNIEEIFRKMNEISKNKGFGRIAGYQEEKNILMNLLGTSIILEKDGQDAKVPNGILFFGPKGCGKTTFADAFAQQLDCNITVVEDTYIPAKNLENLKNAAKNAQETFEKTGIRTILQIDEFEDFSRELTGPLKVFMDNVSNKYHCTIFATTNFPEKIDDILLRAGRFEAKVPLHPANKQNITEILKYYGEIFADNTVNFEKLSEQISKNLSNNAYSNAKLASIITSYVKQFNLTKMSNEDFLKSIKNLKPDIDKKALELFKKQIEIMKHI